MSATPTSNRRSSPLMRRLAIGFLFLALAVDYVPERPQSGLWPSPLFPLGELLYSNLNQLTGIGPLRFAIVNVLIFVFLGMARSRRKSKQDAAIRYVPKVLKVAALLSFGLLMWTWIWGALRGGDSRNGLWQFQQMAFVPFLILMFDACLRGSEDHRSIVKAMFAAATIKTLVGVYFIFAIARPQGVVPEYTTSHSDSMTFVAVVMMAITLFFEKPNQKNFFKGLGMLLVVGIGLFFNDRRLAYVSIGMSLLMATMISPWSPIKRKFVRLVALSLPLIIAYGVVGWRSGSAVFGPVKTIRTIVEGEPGSVIDYRDIENFDVIMTWAKHPILGSGFGHEFDEPYKLPDISFVFPTYRFHPHNSLLGLFSDAGVLGLTFIWAYLVVAVFLGVRAYHRTKNPRDRSMALVCLSIILAYLNQCFGDMGRISWICSIHVALATALLGKLAVEVGAWPSPKPKAKPAFAAPSNGPPASTPPPSPAQAA